MENASKALIIAGAILISIVLITLGVVILGQGQEVVNSSNMDAQAISSLIHSSHNMREIVLQEVELTL